MKSGQEQCLRYLQSWAQYVHYRNILGDAKDATDQFASHFSFVSFLAGILRNTNVLSEQIRFCDLKCSTGSIVVSASLSFDFACCTGIDYDADAIEKASEILDKYETMVQEDVIVGNDGKILGTAPNITFIEANHARFDWSDFDIVYINLLTEDAEATTLFENLKSTRKRLHLMPRGALFIVQTTNREFTLPEPDEAKGRWELYTGIEAARINRPCVFQAYRYTRKYRIARGISLN